MASKLIRIDFRISNNEDLNEEVSLVDDAGAPLSLLGADLRMRVANRFGAPVLDLDLEAGLEILDAEEGKVKVYIAAVDMQEVAPGNYQHDMIAIISGLTRRLWFGDFKVEPGFADPTSV